MIFIDLKLQHHRVLYHELLKMLIDSLPLGDEGGYHGLDCDKNYGESYPGIPAESLKAREGLDGGSVDHYKWQFALWSHRQRS